MRLRFPLITVLLTMSSNLSLFTRLDFAQMMPKALVGIHCINTAFRLADNGLLSLLHSGVVRGFHPF